MSALVDNGPLAFPALTEASDDAMSLARLARYREATYRLLSQSLLYPEKDRLGDVIEAAQELGEERGELSRFTYFKQLSEALDSLASLDTSALADLQTTYLSLFATNTTGIPCPPYESTYLTPPGKSAGWLLAQVERDYAASGFRFPTGAAELPDHVAIELEFMALLCGQEADAWEEQDSGAAESALGDQRLFLVKHPRVWLSYFVRQVAAFDGMGLYANVTAAADAITCHDATFIPALLAMISGEEDRPTETMNTARIGGRDE